MFVRERLLEYLEKNYGITTQQQLEEALAKQKKIDITIFVEDQSELLGESGNGSERENSKS